MYLLIEKISLPLQKLNRKNNCLKFADSEKETSSRRAQIVKELFHKAEQLLTKPPAIFEIL